jgi:hyperosmotically inducible protein
MIATRSHALTIAVLLAFPLAACDTKHPNDTVGQKLDRAVETTKEKTAEAGGKIAAATDKLGDRIEAGSERAAAKFEASDTKVALSDTAITANVKAGLLKDPDTSAVKIEVETNNGVVALNGVAKNDAARTRAEVIAKTVKGVNEVRNYVVVSQS